MHSPCTVIEFDILQNFAIIAPQCSRVRALRPGKSLGGFAGEVVTYADTVFETSPNGWKNQVRFSPVAVRRQMLIPMQRVTHVDGAHPNLQLCSICIALITGNQVLNAPVERA